MLKNRFEYILKYFSYLPLFQFASGLLIGIVNARFGVTVDWEKIFPAFVCAAVSIVFWVWVWAKPGMLGRRAFLAVIILLLGFALGEISYDKVYSENRRAEIAENFGRTVEQLKIVSDGEFGKGNVKYIAVVHEDDNGKTMPAFSEKILLKVGWPADLHHGDIIEGDFRLEEPPQLEDFDYEFYLNSQGIFYTASSYDYEKAGHVESFASKVAEFRALASEKISKSLPALHASLVAGLLWGENANLPEEFATTLSRTGTTHIIAVSGFNVSILVLLIMRLAGVVPRKLASMIAVVVLFLFLMLVGTDNLPALRAGIMGYVILASKTLGRKVHFLSLISIPVIIFGLLRPLSIFTVSFQLSFAATIGIVALADPLTNILKFVPEKIRAEAATTLAAIISTSPVTVTNFQTFSLVALPANILVLPLIPIISLLGFIDLLISFVSVDAARFFAIFLLPMMDKMIGIINEFGGFKFASFEINGPESEIWIIFIFSLIFIFMEISYRRADNAKKSFI